MNFYHLIDHEGFGTIHKLIGPLCEKYKNHYMFTPVELVESAINKMDMDSNSCIVIHSTGRIDSKLISNLFTYFKNNRNIYIFFHTSYNYQCFKKRQSNIIYYKGLEKKYNIGFLVPAKEVQEQFMNAGLKNVKVIQLGIEEIYKNATYKRYIRRLARYYNKIITTCSSSKAEYQYVKGIDTFVNTMLDSNLSSKCLIAGINSDAIQINNEKFSLDDFLNILNHSIAYVQFSRFETYNITAIQAKQFKKPVFLLNAEGNKSCMNNNVYNSVNQLLNDLLNYINSPNQYDSLINDLYLDSINRESLESFCNSFNDLLGGR